jgi:predicted CXXCH cytochrome family protein
MNIARLRRPALACWILVAQTLAAQTPALPAKTEAGAHPAPASPAAVLLYPAQSAIRSTNGLLAVVLTAKDATRPDLVLDGRPIEAKPLGFDRMWVGRTTRMYPPAFGVSNTAALPAPIGQLPDKTLWLAAVPLTPGAHELRLNHQTVRIVQSTSTNPPPGITNASLMVWHPPANNPAELLNCEQCHTEQLSPNDKALGMVRMPQACYTCHDESELPRRHRHVMDPLTRCQVCHDPHGSVQAKLLIDTREKLCIQCHAAGHSKS